MSTVSLVLSLSQKFGFKESESKEILEFLMKQKDLLEIKTAAFNLSSYAKAKGINLKRTHAHEIIAMFLGYKNRHVLNASLKEKTTPSLHILAQLGFINAKKEQMLEQARAKGNISLVNDCPKWIAVCEEHDKIQRKVRDFIQQQPAESKSNLNYFKIYNEVNGNLGFTVFATKSSNAHDALKEFVETQVHPLMVLTNKEIEKINYDEMMDLRYAGWE